MAPTQPADGPSAITRAASAVGSLAEDAWQTLDLRRWGVFLALKTRQGFRRARGSFLPILLASVAAFLAFLISHQLLGHPAPFFAPVAAWICLGFTFNRLPRRVVEMGAGAAMGVAIGEVVFLAVGAGAWQIALGLVVGALIGRLLDRGDLFTMQCGVNAMVVIGLGSFAAASGGPFSRLIDAIVGAVIALLVAVAVPGDVMARPRRHFRWLLGEVGTALAMIADAVRTANPERLRDADALLRGVDGILDDATTVLASTLEITKLNPTLRRQRPQALELDRIRALCNRLVHSVELLLRQSRGVLDEGASSPRVAAMIDQAGRGLHALSEDIAHWRSPDDARQIATGLAGEVSPAAVQAEGWRSVVLVSLLRSVAIDLLQLTGLSRTEARSRMADTEDERGDGPQLPEDEASAIWG